MDSDAITSASYVIAAMKVGCEGGERGEGHQEIGTSMTAMLTPFSHCFHPHKLQYICRHKGVQLQVRPAGRNVEINKLETRLEAQAAGAVKD